MHTRFQAHTHAGVYPLKYWIVMLYPKTNNYVNLLYFNIKNTWWIAINMKENQEEKSSKMTVENS